MTTTKTRNPAGGRGFADTFAGSGYHAQSASAEPLLQRLDGVVKQGKGWRARCPACGGSSRKLSIAEADGRVLVHCFGGCKAVEVLDAVGLCWADIMPPRHWPESPEERRRARQAIREAGWAAALAALALEAAIVRIAAAQVLQDKPLDWNDYCRLVKAEERIGNAAAVFVEARR